LVEEKTTINSDHIKMATFNYMKELDIELNKEYTYKELTSKVGPNNWKPIKRTPVKPDNIQIKWNTKTGGSIQLKQDKTNIAELEITEHIQKWSNFNNRTV